MDSVREQVNYALESGCSWRPAPNGMRDRVYQGTPLDWALHLQRREIAAYLRENADILKGLPAREGHFLLESGDHSDLWFTLDALFVSPHDLAPLISRLANRLRPHGVSAVCGPLLGGAFLAQAVATVLGVDFYFSEPVSLSAGPRLFAAEYRLPTSLQERVRGQRIALVDDVISAGSSVRATADALAAAGGATVVIGALLVLGTKALDHFAGLAIPVESLGRRDFALWEPSVCPHCAGGIPLEDPVHAGRASTSDVVASGGWMRGGAE